MEKDYHVIQKINIELEMVKRFSIDRTLSGPQRNRFNLGDFERI